MLLLIAYITVGTLGCILIGDCVSDHIDEKTRNMMNF